MTDATNGFLVTPAPPITLPATVLSPEDDALQLEVVEQLDAGNWPHCSNCEMQGRDHTVMYLGIVAHHPSFLCETCSTVWAAHLRSPE